MGEVGREEGVGYPKGGSEEMGKEREKEREGGMENEREEKIMGNNEDEGEGEAKGREVGEGGGAGSGAQTIIYCISSDYKIGRKGGEFS